MNIKSFIRQHNILFSIVFTLIIVYLVRFFNVPNPNVILITAIVYLIFVGGFKAGIASGIIVLIYSQYFFSTKHCFLIYSDTNLKKMIVIVIFIPILILLVGILQRQNMIKTKELEVQNEKLKMISRLDPLTNIANRRYFEEDIFHKMTRAANEKAYISLLIVDIDFFKQYNDYYGHVLGDQCLMKVAQTISKEVKKTNNFAARFGGEEFVITLYNMNQNEVKGIAENIMNRIKELKIPHSKSTISAHLTVSIGGATQANFETIDYQNLLMQADKALYYAKNNGRNQLRHFDSI